jgi:hypothetical protein
LSSARAALIYVVVSYVDIFGYVHVVWFFF